ncbi:hypothetical protein AK812_SmicGene44868 [Symbiodinium microadriaticum]|uniref:Uncharacterized protein n=1 Tax=Symbiodinium microadriaticum TaxID=2951 RepID=A0A1Q9BXN7_SYMMI|nr:hypothetical protein AK812_SmicGene44868 [Symbiodinium microadriaticum]
MAEGSRSTNLMCPPLRGTLALSRRRPSETKQRPEVAPEPPVQPVADISDGVLHAAYEDCGVGEGPVEPRRFVSWYRDHLFSLGCEGGMMTSMV